ncbi:MAG: sigma-70 family RNA polymerase sigma factor [Opitutaceae bacterium]
MTEDHELLRRFAEEGAQEAFTELVRRRVDLVYASALRQTVGDAHLAQDVTQAVFVALARRASALQRHPVLAGWLFTTTRLFALDTLRRQRRWQQREREAHPMTTQMSDGQPAWEELRPVIDEAMHELGEHDRAAILLRYFEGLPLARVGVALGLGENAARMRVDRALDKLRERLTRRGITSTAAALGTALGAQPAVSAPLGLAAATAASAGAAAVAVGGPATILMALTTSQKIAAAALVVLLGTGISLVTSARLEARLAEAAQQQAAELARLRTEARTLQVAARRLAADSSAPAAAAPTVDPLARLHAVAALMKEGSIGALTWVTPRPPALLDVPAALREMFALTAAEAAALESALATAQQEIAAQGLAHATATRAGNSVSIEVRPGAEEQAIFQHLREQFRQTLGQDRFALHDEIGWGGSIKNVLDRNGLAPTLITVTNDPTTARLPGYSYLLSRTRVLGPGQGGGGGGGGGGQTSFEGLKLNLGSFATLVPADL